MVYCDRYEYDRECEKTIKKKYFGKKVLIASGDLTSTKAPWDKFENECEVGLARKLFVAIMEACDLEEDCDYQFVSAAYNDILLPNQTPGPLFQSNYLDAALTVNPTHLTVRAALFSIPFMDQPVVDPNELPYAMVVNKTSPAAMALLHAFETGLRRIICNGVYACLVLECGDGMVEKPWKEMPTKESHPELFALVEQGRGKCCCYRKPKCPPIVVSIHQQAGEPWNVLDGDFVDTGLAQALFHAVMRRFCMREGCEYHLVKFDGSQVLDGEFPASALTTGYVDLAVNWPVLRRRKHAVLFAMPFEDVNVNDDEFGTGVMINKKSPFAVGLQKMWNQGLKDLICSGEYRCIIDEFAGVGSPEAVPWESPPNKKSHPALHDLIVHKDCGEV